VLEYSGEVDADVNGNWGCAAEESEARPCSGVRGSERSKFEIRASTISSSQLAISIKIIYS
jgi:hypothetical protein